MTSPDHECPGGCGRRRINPNRLACPDCWRRLPARLRMAIVAAWRSRAGQGSAEHRRALTAALDWYRDQPAPTTNPKETPGA